MLMEYGPEKFEYHLRLMRDCYKANRHLYSRTRDVDDNSDDKEESITVRHRRSEEDDLVLQRIFGTKELKALKSDLPAVRAE